MTFLLNYYCYDCRIMWQDRYQGEVDGQCPVCDNKGYSPRSEDGDSDWVGLFYHKTELLEAAKAALERLEEIEFTHIWESEDDEGYKPCKVQHQLRNILANIH